MAPKSLSDFTSVIQTRRANKASHPGQILNDAKQKRRTPQQMETVRAEETRIRMEKEEHEKESIKTAAEITDQLRKEDIERRSSNRHATGQPQFRPAITSTPFDVESAESKERSRFSEPKLTDPDHADNSDTGSDEYAPPAPGSDEGESEVDLDFEVEEEEEDGEKKPKKGKKVRKGRADISAVRKVADITIARQLNPTLSLLTRPEDKRKAENSDALNPKSKKKPKTSAFLPSSNWDPSSSRGSSAHIGEAEDDDSMVRPGGFIGGEETDDLERKAISDLKVGKKKVLPNTIKITDSKPMVQSTKKAQRGGHNKWKVSHLPAGTSDTFTESLVPLAKLKAGTIKPWDGLSHLQIQELVNKVFPDASHIVNDEDVWCGLVSYRLSNWRNGFHTHAAEAVKRFFEDAKFDEDEVKEFVELYTEVQEGETPTAPFHWREWIVDADTKKITKKGRFQNEMVLYTLAHAHFADYDDVPDPRDLAESDLPIGALVLAVQAVEHAFKFWRNGRFTDDRSAAGHFSGDNYGDKMEKKPGPDGKMRDVLVPNAGRYNTTIRNLSVEKHWVPIFEEANNVLNASRRKKKGRSKSASSRASSEIVVDDVPDFILVSDDD